MKNALIIFLVAVIILLLVVKTFSGFSPSPSSMASVDDVKLMLKSGTPPINVIVNLIKSGVPSDQAEQMVAQAST
jgi:hypothetical protein